MLLRHEFTHVAQWNSQSDGTPRWVIEGIAQYTAYRHHLSAGPGCRAQIVTDAKAHRWKRTCRRRTTFYGADPAQEYHYDMSWLAWEYIAEHVRRQQGQGAVHPARRPSTEPPGSPAALQAEAAAFPPVLHVSETAFVKAVAGVDGSARSGPPS